MSNHQEGSVFMQLAETHAKLRGIAVSEAIVELTREEVSAVAGDEAFEAKVAKFLVDHPTSTRSEAIVELTRATLAG